MILSVAFGGFMTTTHKWKGKTDRKAVITDLKAEADKLLKLATDALDELGDFDDADSSELTHQKDNKIDKGFDWHQTP